MHDGGFGGGGGNDDGYKYGESPPAELQVKLDYGGSGSEVGDSCYASRKMSAVGLGSRLLFFASTTRNSISLRSRRANDSAISRATS